MDHLNILEFQAAGAVNLYSGTSLTAIGSGTNDIWDGVLDRGNVVMNVSVTTAGSFGLKTVPAILGQLAIVVIILVLGTGVITF